MSSKSYSQKLRDPRWQKKRLEILQRDNFTCVRCGSNKDTIHVHHIAYPKSGNPWDSDESDMVSLCSKCHEISDDRDVMRRFREYMATSGHSTRAMMEAANTLCAMARLGFQVMDFEEDESELIKPTDHPERRPVKPGAGKELFSYMRRAAEAL